MPITASSTRAALEREALLTDVLGVQVALETFGCRELPEDVAAFLGREAVVHAAAQELVLQPQALLGIGDLRELGADRAAVDALELRHDLAEFHPLRNRLGAAAGEELGFEVLRAQAEVLQIQHRRTRPLLQPERVQIRYQVSAVVPDLDEARDGRLLGVVSRHRRRHRCGARGALCAFGDLRPDGGVVRLAGGARNQAVEVLAPARIDTRGVAQVLLVERIEIVGVAAEQGCGFEHGRKMQAGP
jgi:hypothetical protein